MKTRIVKIKPHRLRYPGPYRWEWLRTGGVYQIRLMTAGGSQIATFSHSLAKPEDAMAENTADLLCAAPELLAACRMFVYAITRTDADGDEETDLIAVEEAEKMARAATAKAEGWEHGVGFPDPNDEAAWEREAERARKLAVLAGVDLDSLAAAAEERALNQIIGKKGRA